MNDTGGRLQWLWTILLVLAVLLVISHMNGGIANAGWIYDVQGIMAPTMENPVSASFVGELEFPNDDATGGELRISLTNEFDVVTGEPVIRTAPFAISTNSYGPVGTRAFEGTWSDEPFWMQWSDFQAVAQNDFAAMNVDTAGWDAIAIGFVDYQLGSIYSLSNGRPAPAVNEPAAMALLAIGGVFTVGLLRAKSA